MEDAAKEIFPPLPGQRSASDGRLLCNMSRSYDKDENGNVTEIHCTYDPETKSGSGFTGRKVKGTIHWVAAKTAIPAEVRLYENLIDEEKGVYNEEDGSMNIESQLSDRNERCWLEPSFEGAKAYDSFQFVRNGLFLRGFSRFQAGCTGLQPDCILKEFLQAAQSIK